MKNIHFFNFKESGTSHFVYKFNEAKPESSGESSSIRNRLDERVKDIEVGIVNLEMTAESAAELAKSEIIRIVGNSTDPDVLKAKQEVLQRIKDNMGHYENLEKYTRAQINHDIALENAQAALEAGKGNVAIISLYNIDQAQNILSKNVLNLQNVAIPSQYQSTVDKGLTVSANVLQELQDNYDRILNYYSPDSSSFSHNILALANNDPLSLSSILATEADIENYKQALVDAKRIMPQNTQLIANLTALIKKGEEIEKNHLETIIAAKALNNLEQKAMDADEKGTFYSIEGFVDAVDTLEGLRAEANNIKGKKLEEDSILGSETKRIVSYTDTVSNLLEVSIKSFFSDPAPEIQDIQNIISVATKGNESARPRLTSAEMSKLHDVLQNNQDTLTSILQDASQKLQPENVYHANLLGRITKQIADIDAIRKGLNNITIEDEGSSPLSSKPKTESTSPAPAPIVSRRESPPPKG